MTRTSDTTTMRNDNQMRFRRGPFAALALAFMLAAPLQAGLVAHFPLDGDGADASGNGHDGSVFGATAGADRFGDGGGAMTFDGVDDYIDVEQLLFNGDDMTLAFWARSGGAQNAIAVMVSQGHWGADPFADTGFAFQDREVPREAENKGGRVVGTGGRVVGTGGRIRRNTQRSLQCVRYPETGRFT